MTGRPDPDVLQRLIHDDLVPPAQVGARIGRSRAAGYSWLRRYGIDAGGRVVEQDALVAAWRSGRSLTELSADTAVPVAALRERLVTAGVFTPERTYFVVRGPVDPLHEELLRELAVRQGFSAEQIAELTGTTARQVRYRLQRFGLAPGRPGPPPVKRRRLSRSVLTRLYLQQRLPCSQIAARFEVSEETVRQALAGHGIARSSRRAGGSAAAIAGDDIR